jgi:hypothetical protein
VLHDDQVLPSATTLGNICRREYALIVVAIKKQLPVQNKVSLVLDGWTTTNELAIPSVIAYYMDRNWALLEVQLAVYKIDYLIYSRFERKLRMIGQEPTYWSNASGTFEGCA